MLKFKVKVSYMGNDGQTKCEREYNALSYDSKTALLDVIADLEFNDVDFLKVSIKCLGEK